MHLLWVIFWKCCVSINSSFRDYYLLIIANERRRTESSWSVILAAKSNYKARNLCLSVFMLFAYLENHSSDLFYTCRKSMSNLMQFWHRTGSISVHLQPLLHVCADSCCVQTKCNANSSQDWIICQWWAAIGCKFSKVSIHVSWIYSTSNFQVIVCHESLSELTFSLMWFNNNGGEDNRIE